MTFLEALAMRRPMRRKILANTWGPWLHLGTSSGMLPQPQWRRIDTGEPMGLSEFDYLATDWEVMP